MVYFYYRSKDKGGIFIKKTFILALLATSIVTFSKPLIPINAKGALGFKFLNPDKPQLPQFSLDGEVETRLLDIKFTDLISMENNVGVSAGIAASKTDIGLDTTIYYQPAAKIKILKDLDLKVGARLGTGIALAIKTNGVSGGNNGKTSFLQTLVTSLVLGAEYKNIITEVEVGNSTTLDWANFSKMQTPDINPVPELKFKAGYRF